ncbi:PIN domain-containing protein [Leptospira meyeri]|uniref:PIN domain-containing protein n=1 Tax=Leptospira meyeri TaxID=29508 RepID=UPI0002BD6ABF|nr:PIN domain-containing protein [Leptospira meyeri]EMJ87257.1 PIN domain protein [Leptospira meyeri serovar Semaranga str. Veldrot Semarang 173]
MTYIKKIETWLAEIEELLCNLISTVKIKEFRNDPYSGVTFVVNPYFYDPSLSIDQKKSQYSIKKKFLEWKEHFNLLIEKLPNDLKKNAIKSIKYIEEQIELKSNWNTMSTPAKNISEIKNQFEKLYSLIKLYENKEATILVPDTNSLIIQQNFDTYKTLAGDLITILLIPTVFSELDKLKITHREEEFRKKIKKIINQIKGYRSQGSLSEGVTIFKTVTIKAIAKEPNFNLTLSWLDKENNDDRIIASILEYQIENPANKVYLVTADINLQNKAELARIPFFEPPET